MSVSSNNIDAPAGTYLLIYAFSGTSQTAGDIVVQLRDNTTEIPDASVTVYGDTSQSASGGNSTVYTAAAPAQFNLYNASANTVDFTDVTLTALRLV